jgi:four helix bundle protein
VKVRSQERAVRRQQLRDKNQELENTAKPKMIKSYRDLLVWQKAHEFTKKVIKICVNFPRTEEALIIKKQLLRSSTSVPANIAEGYGGQGGKVFRNSLIIARRETLETDYWLLLSFEVGYMSKSDHNQPESGYAEIRAMLSSLITKVTQGNGQ